jgi:dTDP-4-amino-4,6-dideoxyglucose
MDGTKRRVGDLAIFGGRPAFDRPRCVGVPHLPDRALLLERIEEALDRRQLTNGGPLVAGLERRIAELSQVRHCVAVANGTLALEVLIRALGLSGEVIVPSFTFVATAHALQWHGITPVFCDIDEETGNLDPAHVQELVTPMTSAIIGVHLWGRPCDVASLERIAAGNGLELLFDAAHAVGCEYRGEALARFGRAATFSFHPTKVTNSFEGGAIVTDDDELAARVRAMRNFGHDEDGIVRTFGTNARMSEISAAMALTSLDHFDAIVAANRHNHERYRAVLSPIPGVTVRVPGPDETNNLQYVVAEIDESAAGISRDDLLTALMAENIMAKTYFDPGCHRLPPYQERRAVHAPRPLRRTESLAGRVLVLPTGTAVTEGDVDLICEVTRLAVQAGDRMPAS